MTVDARTCAVQAGAGSRKARTMRSPTLATHPHRARPWPRGGAQTPEPPVASAKSGRATLFLVTRRGVGLLPRCGHVAAVLYSIGVPLEDRPKRPFKLRKVNERKVIAKAGTGLPLLTKGPAQERVLAAEGLSDLVGLAMGASADELAPETANTGAKPAWAGRATKAASCATDADAPAKTRRRHRAATTKHKAPKR